MRLFSVRNPGRSQREYAKKMVHSSVPGAVERDQAIRLLTERATLT
jgi:hypothetical protein